MRRSYAPITGAVYLVDEQQKLLRQNPDDPDSYLVFDTLSKTLVRHDSAGSCLRCLMKSYRQTARIAR
ncbi:Uncharacterised protein [Atlantibacter hermannii]|nr:Uncharacterised protein [Atlantibacter hermannii]